MRIAGFVAVSKDLVVLISPRSGPGHGIVLGVRVAQDGTLTNLARVKAPRRATDTAAYAFGHDLVYFGSIPPDEAEGARWNSTNGTWATEDLKCDGRYAFGHCYSPDRVFVFGGLYGTFSPINRRDGVIYSSVSRQWSNWPMSDIAVARHSPSMCWTGKKILIWGGDVIRLEGGGVLRGKELTKGA